MELSELGYNKELEAFRIVSGYGNLMVGRVILEHKERYVVKSSTGEFDSEILGHLRFTAKSRRDFPAVGDWVVFDEYDKDKGIIHAVLPRQSLIERQAVGKFGEKQIIATNIDFALIVQSVDRDFNLNRIQRYLALTLESGIQPIIILNKIDLLDAEEIQELVNSVAERIKDVEVFAISNKDKSGYESLTKTFLKGKTYCLLGSSGVGKSTLLNNLVGESFMKTGEISITSNRGKHVTTHRELVLIENGAIFIDNPGMREVGMVDSEMGLEKVFDTITELSTECKFSNCTHSNEKGCAVLDAIDEGAISTENYENYLRLEREKDHFESTVAERRKKNKEFGKMVKNHTKGKHRY